MLFVRPTHITFPTFLPSTVQRYAYIFMKIFFGVDPDRRNDRFARAIPLGASDPFAVRPSIVLSLVPGEEFQVLVLRDDSSYN